jgi:Glyoxalase/Bleomycin resistance protein/Dioxygenase superfamily
LFLSEETSIVILMPDLPFHHIGYVVDDLEAAVADAVARFGAGPFYVAEHMEFDEVTFRGEPAVFDHSSAFGQWGPVRIELTVIHETDPPELLATMAPGGAGRVGHVGILVDSLEQASAQLEASGVPVYHTGRTGPVSAIWHDAHATLGHSVELLQRNEFLTGLYERIALSAENWDGSEPMRAMMDIAKAA